MKQRIQGGLLFLKTLFHKVREDDCQGLAAEMAYNLIGSIIPGSIFLVSLFGLIGRQMDLSPLAFETVDRFAPPHTAIFMKQVLTAVFQGSSGGLTVLGFGVALWSAGGGASTLIKGMHQAYDLTDWKPPFWYGPFISLVIVFSMGVMALLSVNLILFGDNLIGYLRGVFYVPWNQVMLLQGVRWVIAVVGLLFFSTFVYALLLFPKKHRFDWRGAFPGAAVFLVLWMGISLLFGWYVNRLSQFNPVYGALGAFVIFVTWLYYSAFSVMVGGEVVSFFALREGAQGAQSRPLQDT